MRLTWLNAMDMHGETPMSRLMRCGHRSLLKVVVEEEEHDSPARPNDDTALQRAALWGIEEVVRGRLERGADPNEPDARGETPLHKAVRQGHFNTARTLVHAGADVNASDHLGLRPLHWVAINGREDLARLLLRNGADANARDRFTGGMTPLALANLMGYEEFADIIAQYGGRF